MALKRTAAGAATEFAPSVAALHLTGFGLRGTVQIPDPPNHSAGTSCATSLNP
jgi:hypothetical protein